MFERTQACVPCLLAPLTRACVFVRGHAFGFSPFGERVGGAVVRALEHPDRWVITADDGSFALGGFVPGEPVTLTMTKPGFAPIQTGTHVVPPAGLERLTFQAPPWSIYHLMSTIALVRPSRDRCQIATTVTERGLSLYDDVPSHGEAGATVTLEPRPADVVGPIYFQYVAPRAIVPGRWLDRTTRDGGVLFLDVPPGEYTLAAYKVGMQFTRVRIRCRAGWLVNASPPWGLSALPPGSG